MHLSNQILSHACFMSCSSLCCLTALLHFLVSPSLSLVLSTNVQVGKLREERMLY